MDDAPVARPTPPRRCSDSWRDGCWRSVSSSRRARADERAELAGLPELRLQGLRTRRARAAGLGDHRPARRASTRPDHRGGRGNPLALLELPRGMTPTGSQVASLPGGPLRVGSRTSFRRRVDRCPPNAACCWCAAEPSATRAPWRAAERLGIDRGASRRGGRLIESARGSVRHPLPLGDYRAALRDERRAHQALAEGTDPEVDPDRRAWHRAHAARAGRARRSRAGAVGRACAAAGSRAAAAFLERAAKLTPEPRSARPRALAAARAKRDAGLPTPRWSCSQRGGASGRARRLR